MNCRNFGIQKNGYKVNTYAYVFYLNIIKYHFIYFKFEKFIKSLMKEDYLDATSSGEAVNLQTKLKSLSSELVTLRQVFLLEFPLHYGIKNVSIDGFNSGSKE